MASISKTIRPKRSNNNTVNPAGYGLTVSRGVPVVGGSGGGGGTLTDDGTWISTYEPVNANTLMADDFHRGSWYSMDYDTASAANAFSTPDVHGWGGTIYANPITPAKAIVGGGVGLHGRQYAATSGFHTGAIGGRNMADHGFVNNVHVTEAYFRIYFQYQSDYVGGHEKQFDFTRGSGTGALVALGYNYFGSNTFRFIPYLHQDDGLPGSPPSGGWMQANLTSNINEVNGHWYYLEMRVVMNTPGTYNGIFEFWMDDCGTDGRGGPGTPTKRGSYTNVLYRNSAESAVDIGGIWIENWANEATTGTIYYANVYVSKAFIGFANPAHQP